MVAEILHSKIYGEGKLGTPLLVLHGLFGMLDNWASFGREMGEIMSTHLLDLRNHGRSFHSSEMSHEAMAQDISNYMDYHNIPKAILLGHSLGGKAVMQFTLTHPERTEKLIVADIGPKAYPPHHQGIIKALQTVDFSQQKTRQQVEEVLKGYIPDIFVIQFLAKNLYWKEDKTLEWRFNLSTLAKNYTEYVAKQIRSGVYEGPTLFLAGEISNYILPQDLFGIKQQFPHYELITIPDAGHYLQAQNPADFTSAVRSFIFQNT